MKERGILFSAPMVRALLDGAKTQTRRAMKHQPSEDIAGPLRCERYHPTVIDRHGDEQPGAEIFGAFDDSGEWGAKCPYGEPGDRLWVRETWSACGPTLADGTLYRADFPEGPLSIRFKPSIHMHRWRSRITLEITSVRAERLQGISRGDAMAEGCPFPNMAEGDDPRSWYRCLWESINGAGSWVANPWVWVVCFAGSELATDAHWMPRQTTLSISSEADKEMR